MNPMRNFILALTSFIATVVFLSQVALAEEDKEAWDKNHKVSAPGEEPLVNQLSGKPGDPKQTEAANPESPEDNKKPCNTCQALRAPVKRMKDRTIINDKAGDDVGTSGSTGQKGEQ